MRRSSSSPKSPPIKLGSPTIITSPLGSRPTGGPPIWPGGGPPIPRLNMGWWLLDMLLGIACCCCCWDIAAAAAAAAAAFASAFAFFDLVAEAPASFFISTVLGVAEPLEGFRFLRLLGVRTSSLKRKIFNSRFSKMKHSSVWLRKPPKQNFVLIL